MCTNSRDRLSVAVLFAAIAVPHVLRFDRPHLGGVSRLNLFGLFVVTWLWAPSVLERRGGEGSADGPAKRRRVSSLRGTEVS